MSALRTVSAYCKPYAKQLTIGPACKFLEAVLELVVPMLMSRLIDEGVVAGDPSAIARYGVLCAACVALGLALAAVCQHSASIASQGYGTDLRNDLLRHMQRFSFAQIDRFGTSTLTNRLTADVNQLQFAVAMLIRLVIRAPFLCIGGFAMALILNAPMAMILALVIVVFSALLYAIMARTVPLYRDVQTKLDRVAVILRENLSSARVIRAFDRAADEGVRFAAANRAHANAAQRVGRLTLLINPVTGLLMNAAILALLYFGGIRLSHGNMTTGEIVAFLNYIGAILTAMVVVANLVLTFSRAWASAGRVAEVLDVVPSIESGARAPGDANLRGDGDAALTKAHAKAAASQGLDEIAPSPPERPQRPRSNEPPMTVEEIERMLASTRGGAVKITGAPTLITPERERSEPPFSLPSEAATRLLRDIAEEVAHIPRPATRRVVYEYPTEDGPMRMSFLLNDDVDDEPAGLSFAFEDVAYAYAPGAAPALQGVSFQAKAGETVGVIGGTGSGKSTLVHLIPRLIEASAGVVRVGDRAVRQWDLDALRGQIGIVLQKPAIFSGTVADNLRLGKPDATLEEMREAADIAQALAFIEAMDGGFDARLEAGGTNLSGGQRQRLSIARALVRRPRLLILDDATSALDYLTESALRRALYERMRGMTVVMVSQRAGTLRTADRIVVLDEGRVVGCGMYAELTRDCDTFREIVETQEGRRAL